MPREANSDDYGAENSGLLHLTLRILGSQTLSCICLLSYFNVPNPSIRVSVSVLIMRRVHLARTSFPVRGWA